jgi:hypothetical protein
MKINWIAVLFFLLSTSTNAQVVIGPKGTRLNIDSSKWKIDGNNLYNKNTGRIGIGTPNPTAQLHTTGNLRFENIGSNTKNASILTADDSGNITTRTLSNMLADSETSVLLNTFTSTSKGLAPASGGGTSRFLRADGTFAVPVGNNYRNLITLSTDVINNNATANTLKDLTELAFTVTAGITYRFYAVIPYTSAASNNGSRWTINAPTTTLLYYTSRYTLSATSETVNYSSAINLPANCNNNSIPNGNLAIIEGVIKPSANGTLQIRFASEGGNVAITAKAGASLEYW